MVLAQCAFELGLWLGRKDDPVTALGDWIGSSLDYGPVVRNSSLGSSGWSSQYTFDTESGKKVFAKIALGEDVVMFKGEALGLAAMYGGSSLEGLPKSRASEPPGLTIGLDCPY